MVSVTSLLGVLDLSIVNIALPHEQRDPHISDADRSWVAIAFALAEVSAKLTGWNLEEMAFTAELIISELVTNAIRYGVPPVHMRLLRGTHLVMEVSDGSSTSPHLRYATAVDEGGRGIFLVAQFAERWGTRFTPNGKIVWAEQLALASVA
ncbi:hypothetical protein BJY54_000923 [Streptomyces nodosus]|uniref:Histidine kinase/HSP90-like ATPase domain-containing protein n=1 Tax=Streptomyces nodosus TaxID=40318 RepID=A0A0B5DHB1_9ACTN|nr:hypothetical protein SNOD_04610 [Streptomyces nodosus]MBB4790311.1 hypothetical protein [Streptomyces nodosus]